MNKLSKTVLFVVFCTLLTSIAQIFFKYAADKLTLDSVSSLIFSAITNLNLYIGVIIYFLAAAILFLCASLPFVLIALSGNM